MSAEGDGRRWLTADEAASALRVKKETIYAYVSRGRLTNRRSDDGRGSVFDSAEIERLAAGTRQGAARAASTPDIESELTLLTEAGHFYRGRDARELADTMPFEEVAQLLWGVTGDGAWQPAPDLVQVSRKVVGVLPSTILPVDAIKLAASTISALEPPEWNTSASVIAASARRVFATLVSALPERSQPALELGEETAGSWIVPMLWSRLCEHRPSADDMRLLNGAMIVLADHDLASSAIMARSAARAGVNVGGIIRLGADVGSGPVKGAASLAIEAFLHNIDSPENVETALTMRLRQGEPIPGFGHSQYPDGDPRAIYMLDALRAAAPGSTRLATVEELIRMERERGLPAPNAGFGLAALTYVAGMVPGAGEAVFVLSRSAGWIAHAIEEYSAAPPPRQHSRYIGPAVDARS